MHRATPTGTLHKPASTHCRASFIQLPALFSGPRINAAGCPVAHPYTCAAPQTLARITVVLAASPGGSEAEYTTEEGVALKHADLDYVTPYHNDEYGEDLGKYVWKVCAVRPNEYKEIMEKMQTPEMQNLLKEAQDEIQHRKLSHFPAWQNIARRLSKLPLFEGLVYKAHHARFQGAGKASNVHQDPHLYAYRVVFRFPADGASVSHIDFHVGQRKANGTMKAGDYLATLAIPPGEGYITSAQVTCKSSDPDSEVYQNIFHHNVPDTFHGMSMIIDFKEPSP